MSKIQIILCYSVISHQTERLLVPVPVKVLQMHVMQPYEDMKSELAELQRKT